MSDVRHWYDAKKVVPRLHEAVWGSYDGGKNYWTFMFSGKFNQFDGSGWAEFDESWDPDTADRHDDGWRTCGLQGPKHWAFKDETKTK